MPVACSRRVFWEGGKLKLRHASCSSSCFVLGTTYSPEPSNQSALPQKLTTSHWSYSEHCTACVTFFMSLNLNVLFSKSRLQVTSHSSWLNVKSCYRLCVGMWFRGLYHKEEEFLIRVSFICSPSNPEPFQNRNMDSSINGCSL